MVQTLDYTNRLYYPGIYVALINLLSYFPLLTYAAEHRITVEAPLMDTLVCRQLYLRPPSQNPVLLNSLTNSAFSHSRKQPAAVTDTFFTPRGCLLTRASKTPIYLSIKRSREIHLPSSSTYTKYNYVDNYNVVWDVFPLFLEEGKGG